MPNSSPARPGWSTRLLAAIGCIALLYAAGQGLLHWMRNSDPDGRTDILSPDKVHRMVITEMLVGFPGQTCIKDVYVILASEKLVRTDDDSHVYAGACNGLGRIQWVGKDIEADIDLTAAVQDVAYVTLRGSANVGTVLIRWTGVPPAVSADEAAAVARHNSR